mgnify:FL=1
MHTPVDGLLMLWYLYFYLSCQFLLLVSKDELFTLLKKPYIFLLFLREREQNREEIFILQGVTIPSQRRYLDYFYDIWKHGPRNIVSLMISKIVLYSNISHKSGMFKLWIFLCCWLVLLIFTMLKIYWCSIYFSSKS